MRVENETHMSCRAETGGGSRRRSSRTPRPSTAAPGAPRAATSSQPAARARRVRLHTTSLEKRKRERERETGALQPLFAASPGDGAVVLWDTETSAEPESSSSSSSRADGEGEDAEGRARRAEAEASEVRGVALARYAAHARAPSPLPQVRLQVSFGEALFGCDRSFRHGTCSGASSRAATSSRRAARQRGV